MTAQYGYARVSSTDQDLSIQQTALKAAGCTVIRHEKASGTSRDGRSELATLMDFLRPGRHARRDTHRPPRAQPQRLAEPRP